MAKKSTEPVRSMGPALRPMLDAFTRARRLKINKPNSIRFATYQVELLYETLSTLFPGLTPPQLTLDHLEEMVEYLVSGKSGHSLKPSTLKQYVMYVRCIFRFLHQRGHMPGNPAGALSYCPTSRPQHTRWIRDEEVARLFIAAEGDQFVDIRETAIMRLMLDLGPRISELLSLQIQDLYMTSRRVSIEQGKRDQNAIGGFGEGAQQALERYLAARAKRVRPSCTHLFINQNGTPMRYRAFDKRLKFLAAKAGIESLTSHRFRATSGVRTYLQTRSLISVKTKLRHKTLKMSYDYVEQAEQEIMAQHSADRSVSDDILGPMSRPDRPEPKLLDDASRLTAIVSRPNVSVSGAWDWR